MTFLLPIGLAALLTLPLIVLLHLLRDRQRRATVPSLLHWLNLPRRPDGERIRRLPLTLLLLLHLIVAALLSLALGRPQLPGALRGAARQTAIVLDTSTSMAAREGFTTRFAQAQEQARAILRGMVPGDRAFLIAAGRTPRVVAAGGPDNLAILNSALDALQPGGTGVDLPGALTLAEATLDQQAQPRIVVISDGALPPLPARAMTIPVEWQNVGGDQPNRAIVAFAARPAGATLHVYARVANYDAAPFATSLRLYAGEQLLNTRDLTIASDGETELTWTLPAEHATLRAELDGRDALPQDDLGYLNVATTRPISALLVTDEPEPLQRALAAVPGVRVTVVAPSRYGEASHATIDLTIFDNFLPEAWPAGAVLAIAPPSGSPLLETRRLARSGQTDCPLLATENRLIRRAPIFEGLGLDGICFRDARRITPPAWATTQLAVGDVPLVLRGRSGASEIAIWAFGVADSNLSTRLAFPLLVARTMRDLAPASLPPRLQAGDPLALRPDPRATEIQLAGPDGTPATFAAAAALTIDSLIQPGFYRVEEHGDNVPIFAGQVGVNAGAPIESDLRPRPAPQFDDPSQTAAPAPQRHMIDLWPWLALAALITLVLEWGYIHR